MEWIIPTLLYRCTCRWNIRFSLRCEQLLTAKHWGIFPVSGTSCTSWPCRWRSSRPRWWPAVSAGIPSYSRADWHSNFNQSDTRPSAVAADVAIFNQSDTGTSAVASDVTLPSTNQILASLRWLLTSLYHQSIRCQTRLLTSHFLPPIRDSPYANINQKPVPKMKSPYLPLARGLFVTVVSAIKMFSPPHYLWTMSRFTNHRIVP